MSVTPSAPAGLVGGGRLARQVPIAPRLAGLAVTPVGNPAPPAGAPRALEVATYLSTSQHRVTPLPRRRGGVGQDGVGQDGVGQEGVGEGAAMMPAVALLGGPGDSPAAPRLACTVHSGQGGAKATRIPTHASVVRAPRTNGGGGYGQTVRGGDEEDVRGGVSPMSPRMVSQSHCAAPAAPHGHAGGFTVISVGLLQRGATSAAGRYVGVEFEYAPAPRPRVVLLHSGLVPGRVVEATRAFWSSTAARGGAQRGGDEPWGGGLFNTIVLLVSLIFFFYMCCGFTWLDSTAVFRRRECFEGKGSNSPPRRTIPVIILFYSFSKAFWFFC